METCTDSHECYTGGEECKLYWRIFRCTGTTHRSSSPTIMPGLSTGLMSGGAHKAISGSGVATAAGDGLYLHKHGKCYRN